ncbi:rCG36939 [Rattus norvegicus]|uniref:RCG36939 n=1 Tax=Rattus norvegicus TaxID=10116 RepID=A6HTI0_RAT|nr:rCG36939 [Rattus norvegicus]
MTLDTFLGLQIGLSLSSRSFALGCPFSPENSYSARSLKKSQHHSNSHLELRLLPVLLPRRRGQTAMQVSCNDSATAENTL